ncbi:MAG: transglutaminase family protein [Myxococcales bacterium]|nr:transglutaminase family protein [Myxococcales bacterium]
MLYDIVLRILYRYEQPANAGRHLVRAMPADLPGEQRLVAGALDVLPAGSERASFTDFFGNSVLRLTLGSPHDELGITVRARVDRRAPAPSGEAETVEELADALWHVRTLAPSSPHHFTGPSVRVPRLRELREFGRAHVHPEMSAHDALVTLGEALHEELRFDSDATTVDTPVADAFEARHGVCQDFAHIMIGCLREVGIPAAYVSGFLRTEPPAGSARLEGADAMHAWVRAWCGPTLGWVEYDPTNGVSVRDDHVVVARGRDYSDVAPIRGVLRTAGAQQSTQLVDVLPITDAELAASS